jgi:hypothetical protein
MSDNYSHGDSYSPRDGFYDGTADDAHDLSRDDSPISQRWSGRGGRAGLSGAPGWVKALVSLGSLLAVAGMAVIFLSVFGVLDTAPPISAAPQGLSLELSPDVKLGFGLFIAGFVLNVIGAIAQSVSSRR